MTRLRRVYCERRSKLRLHPACVVLKDDKLLKNLVYDGKYPPEDCASLESRRNWLKRRIFRTGDSRTPVPLLQNSSAPPLHTNAFKKRTQKMEQLERFNSFVAANSIPTGRQQHGKTHYIMPTIRRIRTPPKLKECANDALPARHAEMTRDSLIIRVNESLSALEPPLPPVSHNTICTWLKEFVPRYVMSPLQLDYCYMCSELKQQVDSARRAKHHLIDNGDAEVSDICTNEVLIISYEANLRQNRELAAKEHEEYEHRIA